MRYELIFPLAIVTLSYGASVVYLGMGNWRQTLFWACAGTINLVVTI